MEGFLHYKFGGLYLEGLIHGGAYFQNFIVRYQTYPEARTCLKYKCTKGAFQKSELTGQTIAGPVIFTMKNAFFQEFLLKHYRLCACYLGFD